MSHFSTLYQAASQPTIANGSGGTMPDPQQYALGGTWYHGQPGAAVPATATRVLRDGTAAWTWNAVVAELASTDRALIAPHRWDDEPTDANLDVTQWPLLQPAPT